MRPSLSLSDPFSKNNSPKVLPKTVKVNTSGRVYIGDTGPGAINS